MILLTVTEKKIRIDGTRIVKYTESKFSSTYAQRDEISTGVGKKRNVSHKNKIN